MHNNNIKQSTYLVNISTWEVQQITRFQHSIQDRWRRQVSIGEIRCTDENNITSNYKRQTNYVTGSTLYVSHF